MSVLLDTHALLWWRSASSRLSARAAREIAAARTVWISPVSCWETGMLVAKGRVTLDRDLAEWIRDLFEEDRVEVAPLSPAAAAQASCLVGFSGDPADRLLCASAAELAVPLVSKDGRIRRWARETRGIRTVW